MKKTLLILTALISTASARIGETPTQCKARYGEPLSVDKKEGYIIFKKSGILIATTFLKGKCSHILFQNLEKNILDIPEELSDNILEKLLAANGANWKKKNLFSLDKTWESEDGKRHASYGAAEHRLVIATSDFIAHREDQEKKKEDEKLNDF